MKTIAIIPAFNEARTIAEVIESVKENVDEVIVVDDGSSDKTTEIASNHGALVYTHLINCGLGAVLGTGIEAALNHGADIIITFDADGQHEARDIPRLIRPLLDQEREVVIGSRFLDIKENKKAPRRRLFYNKIGNLITFLLFGLWVSDSQSGFRAFTRQAAQSLNLKSNRMEVSSEIIKEIKKNKWRFREVSIKPIYTTYSMSKGQNFKVGVRTFCHLLLRSSK